MSITLIGKDQVPLNEIAEYLKPRVIEGVSLVRMREVLHGAYAFEHSAVTFLVSATQNVVDEGEAAEQVRAKLGSGPKLVLCMLRPSDPNAQRLLKGGVDEIISPAGLDAESLAERILAYLIQHAHAEPSVCGELRGATLEMRNIFSDIERYAKLDEAVLIRGETGTGKGLVARALHQKAGRDGKLVTIVCAGTNPELLGSSLFGHVEGAFTGANKARVGLIDSAREGTAFIDEIGDLDANLQITLLRVVEEKVFLPVGSDSEKTASARFVFATYCDLEELLAKGSFRQDLYARINRLVIELPPLRKRHADIPLLVDHLLERFKKKNKTSVDIGAGAVDELFRYDWPLNVRELDDVVCRAAAKATGRGPITGTMFRESIRDPRDLLTVNNRPIKYANTVGFDPLIDSWPQVDERAKTEYFRALAKVAESMEHAIALSKIGRAQLYKILADYDLKLKP